MTSLSVTVTSLLRKASILSLSLLLYGLGLSVGTAEAQPYGGFGWCDPDPKSTKCTGTLSVSTPGPRCNAGDSPSLTCPLPIGCEPSAGYWSGDFPCGQCLENRRGVYRYEGEISCTTSGGGGGGGGGGGDVGSPPPPPPPPAMCGPANGRSYSLATFPTDPLQLCLHGVTYGLITPGLGGISGWLWGCHVAGFSTVQCSANLISPPPPPAPTVSLTVSQTTNPGNTTGNGGSITIPSNQTATLSWRSTNAVSCTATGNWAGAKGAVSGQAYAEATSALAGGAVYTYNLRCTNSAGVSATNSVRVTVNVPLVDPVSIATCSPAGNSVTLSWNPVPTAAVYPLRINDTVDPWGPGPGQGCAFSTSPNDTCLDSIVTLSYTRPVIPGHTYQAWMHSCRPGECSPGLATTSYPFRCDAPIPPPVATLDVNPAVINIHPTANQKATLTWGSSGNVTSCVGTNFNTGNAISGSIPNLQPAASTTYTVVCSGPGGNSLPVSKTLTVVSVCNPDSTCGGTRSGLCTDEKCSDVCGNRYDGTKDCRRFWKEVAP